VPSASIATDRKPYNLDLPHYLDLPFPSFEGRLTSLRFDATG
jgi:hypothetical protein